jgi:hypothetical protein
MNREGFWRYSQESVTLLHPDPSRIHSQTPQLFY